MSKYYNMLNIAKDATMEEVKKAYRKLAMELHPDRNPGDKKAEEKFKEITEAYSVLSDPDQRKKYDAMGDSQFQNMRQGFGAGNGNYEDIFQNIDFDSLFRDMNFDDNFFGQGRSGRSSGFGMGGGARKGQKTKPGANAGGRYDLEQEITVGFMEAYKGSERHVSFSLSNGDTIDARIKIPPGISTDKKLRVRGHGLRKADGSRGDLYLKIRVSQHPDFIRVGDDVETHISVPYSFLCLGGPLTVLTPEGSKQVKVKPTFEDGVRVRLKGLGFPVMGASDNRGDFFAVLNLKFPTESEVDSEMTALLEQLKEKGS